MAQSPAYIIFSLHQDTRSAQNLLFNMLSTMRNDPTYFFFSLICVTHAAQNRGTFTIDCATAPEACENACFWMSCANPPQPNQQHVFHDIGNDPGNIINNRNRAQSGVKASNGPPCRALPFSQRFYDTVPNWQNLDLETDEFPLAKWQQANFVDRQWPPRNTLRCIPNDQNRDVGEQYKYFRHGDGPWNPTSHLYDPNRGPQRLGARGAFSPGDWFQVGFINTNGLRYCQLPPHLNCDPEDPPREFHMVEKRTSDGRNSQYDSGIIHIPYDYREGNTYSITNVATRAQNYLPIKNFRVVIRRQINNGFDRLFLTRQAYDKSTGSWPDIAQQEFLGFGGAGDRATSNSVTNLPNDGPAGPVYAEMHITRIDKSFCGDLFVEFGTRQNNAPANTNPEKAFAFFTHTEGYQGKYCEGENAVEGQLVWEWTCTFPGI